jgi:hypothetical protein
MDRIVTILGIILAVLAAVFSLASLVTAFVPLMLAAAVVLVGVGVVTGR